MFGYVVCDKDELKVRQFRKYRAHYCGVCKAIKRKYGIACCALLTYDAAALAIAVSVYAPSEYKMEGCVINPLKKVMVARGDADEFAASANVLLAVGKLEDDWQDDRNPLAGFGAFALKRAKGRAAARIDPGAGECQASLEELYSLERQGSDSVDATSGAFGGALSAIMGSAPVDEEIKSVYENIGFNLGKWIYLADAVDDIEKDEKKRRYNVFLKKFGSAENARANTDILEFNLLSALSQAGWAADLLKDCDSTEILLNILDGGARKKTRAVLRQEDK